MNRKIDLIFMLIIAIISLYFYCTTKKDIIIKEHFNTTEYYDNSATMNLDSICKKIINDGNLIVHGNMKFGSGLKIGITDVLPVGSIISYSSNTLPDNGWLICDGSPFNTGLYPELNAVLGATYGAGRLPDLRGRVIISSGGGYNLGALGGTENETITISTMPSHNHGPTSTNGSHQHGYNTQAWWNTAGGVYGGRAESAYDADTGVPQGSGYDGNGNHTHTINNTGGGQSHNNIQPYIALNYIIRAK